MTYILNMQNKILIIIKSFLRQKFLTGIKHIKFTVRESRFEYIAPHVLEKSPKFSFLEKNWEQYIDH